MKRYADVLIDKKNNKYKRVSIWTVLDWRKNNIDLWEKYNDSFFSTNKEKAQMVFRSGRGGVECRSYFAYKNAASAHEGEGYETTYRHEFFKECFSRLEYLNLRWKGNSVKIYVDEAIQEETVYGVDGRKRIVDVLIKFTKSEPMIYVEKWNGVIAVEVFETHQIGPDKIYFMKKNEMAIFEFDSKKWKSIEERASSQEEEEKHIEKIVNVLKGYISGNLLNDPISKKYFSTVRLEEELEKNDQLEEQLANLESYNQKLLIEKSISGKKVHDLQLDMQQKQIENDNNIKKIICENNTLRIENDEIKSSWFYKIFYHRKK